ncbi:unnamed protein product [Amoebophrya sp. A25]|nr:unnamed protein product [Amoebophrya sp. A25]|eukprot:GSA25T00005014001.1
MEQPIDPAIEQKTSERDLQIVEAVVRGDLQEVTSLLRKHDGDALRFPNQVDMQGNPCIKLARELPMLKLLLKFEANPNATDFHGVSALHHWASKPSAHQESSAKLACRVLLRHKAYVGAMDEDGNTPLQHAVAHGRFETAQFLLSHGSNLWVENKRQETAIHAAISRGDRALCGLLLTYAGLGQEGASAPGMIEASTSTSSAASTSDRTGTPMSLATSSKSCSTVPLPVHRPSKPVVDAGTLDDVSEDGDEEFTTEENVDLLQDKETDASKKVVNMNKEQVGGSSCSSSSTSGGTATAPSSEDTSSPSSSMDILTWKTRLGDYAFGQGQYDIASRLLEPAAFDAKWISYKEEKRKIQRLQDAVIECCEDGDLVGLQALLEKAGKDEDVAEVDLHASISSASSTTSKIKSEGAQNAGEAVGGDEGEALVEDITRKCSTTTTSKKNLPGGTSSSTTSSSTTSSSSSSSSLVNIFTTPNEEGDFALVSAMENNQEEIVMWLLDYFSSRFMKDHEDVAAPTTSTSRLLNVQESSSGETCLMKAARVGSTSVVKRLLELGADRSIESELNQTALSLAKSWKTPCLGLLE